MQNPDVFQGDFLFVNKNATNVKSRSPYEAFTIGSHVCGQYARWRKVARVKPRGITHIPQSELMRIRRNPNDVKGDKDRTADITVDEFSNRRDYERENRAIRSRSSLTQLSSISSSTMRGSSKSVISEANEEAETARPAVKHLSDHLTDSNAEASRLVRLRPKEHSEVSHRTLWPSPRTILQKGNSDPFSAAVLSITPARSFLMNIWEDVYLGIIWPVDADVALRAPALIAWQNDARDVVASKARLQGLFTWTLMLQICSLPESSNRSKMLTEYLVHKKKCLESLRWDLSQGESLLNIVPVLLHLAGAEFYAGDLSVAMIHFTAAKAMVESCGGLRALPWALQSLVIFADMALSKGKTEPVLFAVEQWNPGSILPYLSRAEAEVLALSPHLIGSSHYELPESVMDVFRDYEELLAVYELVDAIPNQFRRTELLRWAQLRQYALNSGVTERRRDIAAAPVATESRASEIITCIAVDYFQQLFWHIRYKARSRHVLFHHPRPSFNELLPNKDLVSPHLKLWIYFLAATVEQIDCSHYPGEKRGHAERFLALTEKFGLRSAQDLRRIFNYFLYDSGTLDRYLVALLEMAENPAYYKDEVPT